MEAATVFKTLPHLPVARRWRGQGSPAPSVLALIRRDGVVGAGETLARYLLIQRQTEPYTGKWALVGGMWDFGETLETAVTREVKEETGLDTTFVALRGLVNERLAPFDESVEGCHFLLFVCEVAAPTGEAREQSEGPVAWFSSEDLEKLSKSHQIVPTDFDILQRLGWTMSAFPYLEAGVMVSHSGHTPDRLVSFKPGPQTDQKSQRR